MNLGARYNFSFWGAPASVRAQVANITDNFAWDADNSGAFFSRAPRRFMVNFTADF